MMYSPTERFDSKYTRSAPEKMSNTAQEIISQTKTEAVTGSEPASLGKTSRVIPPTSGWRMTTLPAYIQTKRKSLAGPAAR